MSKRIRIVDFAPRSADGKGYAVGYKKPPKHGQFRPGETGNPAGRTKGVRNLKTDVKRTLRVPVKVNEGGRSRKISTQAGMLMVLREKALKGDARALDRLVELANRFNNEPGSDVARTVPADDREILAAYAAEIGGSTATSVATTDVPPPPRYGLLRSQR
jgi:Family of unknown function (DUF5681)